MNSSPCGAHRDAGRVDRAWRPLAGPPSPRVAGLFRCRRRSMIVPAGAPRGSRCCPIGDEQVAGGVHRDALGIVELAAVAGPPSPV